MSTYSKADLAHAVRAASRIAALSRGAWNERRIQVYAETLLDGRVPAEWLDAAVRRLLVTTDPDQLSPARVIAECRACGDPNAKPQLPAPDVPRGTNPSGLEALVELRKRLEGRFTLPDDRGTAPESSGDRGRSEKLPPVA